MRRQSSSSVVEVDLRVRKPSTRDQKQNHQVSKHPGFAQIHQRSIGAVLCSCLIVFSSRAQTVTPARITSLRVDNGNVHLQWQGGSTTSQVQCATSLAGPWYDVDVPTTGSSVTNIMNVPGALYRVLSVVVNPAAANDTAAPTVPTGFAATAQSSNQINLSWNASTDPTPSSGIKGYNLYRNDIFLKQVPASLLSAADSGLCPSRTYNYSILAIDNAGHFSAKANASADTPSGDVDLGPPGQLQLAKAMLGTGTAKETLGVAADHLGDMIVVGDFQGTINFGNGAITNAGGYDAFVAKYDAQGALLWTKRLGAAGDDSARGVAVDSQDNIIVVGSFMSTVDFGGTSMTSVPDPFGRIWSDIFVVKYSPSGTLIWAKRFGGTAPDTGDAIAVDGNDNLFVAARLNSVNADFGSFTLSTVGNIDVALMKLNSDGTALWAKRFGGTDGDWAHGLAVDPSGDVVVTGEFWRTTDLGGGPRTSSGAADIFVAKYSGADGTYRWGKTFGGGGVDRGYSVTVDPQTGNVIMTGGFGGAVDFGGGTINGGIFLAGYDSAGNHLWSQGYGSSSTVDSGLSVNIDGNGNLAFGGAVYAGAMDVGGGWLIGNGNADLFVAGFTVLGDAPPAYRWARRAGAGMNGVSQANAVALDGLGHLMIGGTFQMTVDFGGVTATGPAASTAAFMAQYVH